MEADPRRRRSSSAGHACSASARAADRSHRRVGGLSPAPGPYFEKLVGFPWTAGQTINLAIGQGALQVSPLQLAVAYSALINGGTVVRPHVAQAVLRDGVRRELRFKPVRKLKLSPYTSAIKQGLYEAANTASGTSFAVFNGFPVRRRQDGDGRGRPRRRLVVRVLGAVQRPEARRRRHRARRFRRRRGRTGREADLPGVLPPEGLVTYAHNAGLIGALAAPTMKS